MSLNDSPMTKRMIMLVVLVIVLVMNVIWKE